MYSNTEERERAEFYQDSTILANILFSNGSNPIYIKNESMDDKEQISDEEFIAKYVLAEQSCRFLIAFSDESNSIKY